MLAFNAQIIMNKETIAFFDLLKKPLSREEHDFFHSPRFFSPADNVNRILFKGRDYFSYLDNYSARNSLAGFERWNAEYEKRVMRYRSLLQMVPFVRMVAVCNSLAFKAADEKSDIDLFVIAAKNRLFLARILLTALVHVLGLRRHGTKIAGRFCLSFFVSEEKLDLSDLWLGEDDIYFLMWMRGLKPLFGSEIFENLISANKRFRKFFPKAHSLNFEYVVVSAWASYIRRSLEFLMQNTLFDKLEIKLREWQLTRAMAKRDTLPNPGGTILNEHVLKFHDNDKRAHFSERWKLALDSI